MLASAVRGESSKAGGVHAASTFGLQPNPSGSFCSPCSPSPISVIISSHDPPQLPLCLPVMRVTLLGHRPFSPTFHCPSFSVPFSLLWVSSFLSLSGALTAAILSSEGFCRLTSFLRKNAVCELFSLQRHDKLQRELTVSNAHSVPSPLTPCPAPQFPDWAGLSCSPGPFCRGRHSPLLLCLTASC